MRTMISVILPAYNAELFIEKAICSILNQTFVDFELIVIDDGSKDNTKSIVQELSRQDSRIKFISQQNSGCSSARNTAISYAKSNLIAMMDADDIADPSRLELQYRYMEEHPEVSALGGQVQLICQRGIPFLDTSTFPLNHKDIESASLQDDGIKFCQPTVMIRKEALLKTGLYDESLKLGEDVDLFLRLALVGELHNLPERLLYYRRHVSNATSSDSISSHSFELDYLKRAWDERGLIFPEDYVHWSKMFVPSSKKEYYLQWGWNALKKGEIRTAREYAYDLFFSRSLFSFEVIKFTFCSIRGY